MSSPRLSHAQRDALYERHLRPDVMAGAHAAETPVAMIVAGQPGAGVPLAAAALRRELTRATGTVVQLSTDRLRAYHPAWRPGTAPAPLHAATVQPEVSPWFERLVHDAQQHRFHLLIEDELHDPRALYKLAVALRKDRYVVQAVFVATNRDQSTLSVMARYDRSREHGLPARFVTALEHDAALGNVRVAMGLLEDRRAVDSVRLIDRHVAQLYENRLVAGEWSRAPRAQATLDVVRDRVAPPRDLVRLAMQWETLAQRLAHDPDVPGDVASQALLWRHEAAARCEATPATAQMLLWAREGAAFRRMDRFEFEHEFPHHARAVKSLGAAVLEAEKYDPTESARFLASAHENIAQRIERGDMARIAAREKLHPPPTR